MIITSEFRIRRLSMLIIAASFWLGFALAGQTALAGDRSAASTSAGAWKIAQTVITPDAAKPDAADAEDDAAPDASAPDEDVPDEAAPNETPADEAAPADGSSDEEAGHDEGGVELPRDADGHVAIPGVPEYKAPEVLRDLSLLPFPARRMRELLIEAARSGDIEKLRPLIGTGDSATQLALGGVDEDPIEYLKSLSGDQQGYEVLAMLEEVLEAGFVRLDAGTEAELYVWPYFFTTPLSKLTPAQRVELYRLVTHGDYEDMKAFGAYNFYRTAITPQGKWQFFVAGD